MEIKVSRIKTNNFNNNKIQPEFIIIHYSAGDWNRIKYHFEKGGNSAHFVIDLDGSVDEVVSALTYGPFEAYHAGFGTYSLSKHKFNFNYPFNKISIGIELINLNGNLFKFTDKQYISLTHLIKKLQNKYQTLNDPERIIGHEHIAFYRGKVDPGLKFDWQLLFKSLGYKEPFPKRISSLSSREIKKIKTQFEKETWNKKDLSSYWDRFNYFLESYAKMKFINSEENIKL